MALQKQLDDLKNDSSFLASPGAAAEIGRIVAQRDLAQRVLMLATRRLVAIEKHASDAAAEEKKAAAEAKAREQQEHEATLSIVSSMPDEREKKAAEEKAAAEKAKADEEKRLREARERKEIEAMKAEKAKLPPEGAHYPNDGHHFRCQWDGFDKVFYCRVWEGPVFCGICDLLIEKGQKEPTALAEHENTCKGETPFRRQEIFRSMKPVPDDECQTLIASQTEGEYKATVDDKTGLFPLFKILGCPDANNDHDGEALPRAYSFIGQECHQASVLSNALTSKGRPYTHEKYTDRTAKDLDAMAFYRAATYCDTSFKNHPENKESKLENPFPLTVNHTANGGTTQGILGGFPRGTYPFNCLPGTDNPALHGAATSLQQTNTALMFRFGMVKLAGILDSKNFNFRKYGGPANDVDAKKKSKAIKPSPFHTSGIIQVWNSKLTRARLMETTLRPLNNALKQLNELMADIIMADDAWALCCGSFTDLLEVVNLMKSHQAKVDEKANSAKQGLVRLSRRMNEMSSKYLPIFGLLFSLMERLTLIMSAKSSSGDITREEFFKAIAHPSKSRFFERTVVDTHKLDSLFTGKHGVLKKDQTSLQDAFTCLSAAQVNWFDFLAGQQGELSFSWVHPPNPSAAADSKEEKEKEPDITGGGQFVQCAKLLDDFTKTDFSSIQDVNEVELKKTELDNKFEPLKNEAIKLGAKLIKLLKQFPDKNIFVPIDEKQWKRLKEQDWSKQETTDFSEMGALWWYLFAVLRMQMVKDITAILRAPSKPRDEVITQVANYVKVEFPKIDEQRLLPAPYIHPETKDFVESENKGMRCFWDELPSNIGICQDDSGQCHHGWEVRKAREFKKMTGKEKVPDLVSFTMSDPTLQPTGRKLITVDHEHTLAIRSRLSDRKQFEELKDHHIREAEHKITETALAEEPIEVARAYMIFPDEPDQLAGYLSAYRAAIQQRIASQCLEMRKHLPTDDELSNMFFNQLMAADDKQDCSKDCKTLLQVHHLISGRGSAPVDANRREARAKADNVEAAIKEKLDLPAADRKALRDAANRQRFMQTNGQATVTKDGCCKTSHPKGGCKFSVFFPWGKMQREEALSAAKVLMSVANAAFSVQFIEVNRVPAWQKVHNSGAFAAEKKDKESKKATIEEKEEESEPAPKPKLKHARRASSKTKEKSPAAPKAKADLKSAEDLKKDREADAKQEKADSKSSLGKHDRDDEKDDGTRIPQKGQRPTGIPRISTVRPHNGLKEQSLQRDAENSKRRRRSSTMQIDAELIPENIEKKT
jgi:hypothetical protein